MLGLNLVFALLVVYSELKRKRELRKYASQHPFAIFLCLLLSPVRANVVCVLGCRFFQSSTDLFSAPIPKKLRTKFRLCNILLALEGVVQGTLLLLVQDALLATWTPFNIVSFASSSATLLGSIIYNYYVLARAAQSKKGKAQIELANAGDSQDAKPSSARISAE